MPAAIKELPLQASRTFNVLGLLGVSGHVAEYTDTSKVVSDAQYLGLTHWRDGIGWTSPQLAVVQSLVNAGISIIGLPLTPAPPTNISVSANIASAKAVYNLGPGARYALEGPNEPSNFPIEYNGVNSATGPSFLPVALPA
jgi:hypothetical protein